MPVRGTPKFDALALMEIEPVDFRNGQPILVAHAAFIETTTGKTYGRTTGRACWSKETFERLEEFRASMEQDMANMIFGDGALESKLRATTLQAEAQASGIGEELSPDVRSV